MKQLFAILVLVSFFAYGQHTNVVVQQGPNNESYVTQEFIGSGTSYDGNEAYVTQLGSTNYSNLLQDNNGYAGSKEWAQIYQDGNNNTSGVQQKNDGHEAWVTSLGNSNEVSVFQAGNKNDGTVYQDGNNNLGTIHEFATFSSAYIYQDGNNNTAHQTIGLFGSGANGSSHFVAIQDGNNNYSEQSMQGDEFPGAIDDISNTGDVTQIGNNNTAYQIMTTGGFDCSFNNADLYQDGNSNQSFQYQERNNNTSTVTQDGNGNYSFSDQN